MKSQVPKRWISAALLVSTIVVHAEGAVITDRNHKKIDRSNLRVGASVVVIALGHDMFDLEAFEIQLVDK